MSGDNKNQQPTPVVPTFPERVKLGPNEIIVITGGSGFLGQHIVRVLQERGDGIKEIRIVDIVPFQNKLDYVEAYPVEFYNADITIQDNLDAAFSGATCVIHVAAIVQVGHYVNRNLLKSVNMIGTTNVMVKCRQWNISKLVVTSTVDSVFLKDSIFACQSEAGIELSNDEDKFLMGYYGFTKAHAESIVICGRNTPLANGRPLKTAILRLTALYGELDLHCVPAVLKSAKSTGGKLLMPKVMKGGCTLQVTYAGNAAWAHALALAKLHNELQDENQVQEWRRVDGETIFVTDDTDVTNIYEFSKPFLKLKGFSVVQLPIPVSVLLLYIIMMDWLIQHFFSNSWKKWLDRNPTIPTVSAFRMAHSTVHLRRIKATECLDYSPIYTESQAKILCAKYYLDFPI